MAKLLLEISQATKYFAGLRAVDDVNFRVFEGQICGLIGPNGAGKTTLFNIITGFLSPTSGKVIFNETDITGTAPETIAKMHLVRTFQQTNMFSHLTVFDNVLTGTFLLNRYNLWDSIWKTKNFRNNEDELKKLTYQTLRYCEMEHLSSTRASNLSYGNQKKLGLAIALATRPQLLLLDEPAAGLNNKETMQMASILKKIQKDFGITILLVEHDLKFVMSLCENIVVLNHGQKIAEGPPNTIKEHSKVVEVYLGTNHQHNSH